jgi:hypothetical protein
MKTLSASILVIAIFFAFFEPVHAQTTTHMGPAVAFVKASRDTLFIQPLGNDSPVQAYYLPTLITALTGGEQTWYSINQLAVIGMTRSGNRLLIGGTLDYLSPSSGVEVTYQGLMTIPWPLSTISLTDTVNFILPFPGNVTNTAPFRPVGVMSADGSQWWAVLSSNSPADDSLKFYHGHTDGSGGIDSSTYPQLFEEGFQMSNLAVDTQTNAMFCTTVSAMLDAQPQTNLKLLFFSWDAGSKTSPEVAAEDYSSVYQGIGNPIYEFQEPNGGVIYSYIDSMFGFTVIPMNDGRTALTGLCTDGNANDPSSRDNSINLYQNALFPSTFNMTTPAYTIARSIIDPSQDFFSGQNCGLDTEDFISPLRGQMGNAGDVSCNAIGGDSILFITHESPEDCSNRGKKSGIYYYDYTDGAQQSATLVYNDPNAQELQPVWVVAPYTTSTVAPVYYPGIAWDPVNNVGFGPVDSGNTSQPMTYTFIDSSSKTAVTLDSATISGPNASDFTIVSGKVSNTLQPQKTEQIIVTFSPVGPDSGAVTATLKVYFEGRNVEGPIQYTLAQSLIGTAVIPPPTPPNSVTEDAVLSAGMTIDPNPFTSSAFIQLTTPDAGALSIVVHDALGRTVYASEHRETGAGQTQSFEFDAKSLGLPNGVYYVTAFLGERQASRKVVFIR